MNILDYVKPLVEEIYSREPDFDNDIFVKPDRIIIKEIGRFPYIYTIQLTDNNLFNIVANSEGWTREINRETIEQVINFIFD